MGEQAERTGDYPIERRRGEVERLLVQSEVLAADTAHMLDRIGVGPGWRCLDLGCGPCGITAALSARVGPTGGVIGLDFDPEFVALGAESASANTRFIVGDAYRTGLPDASFDLVHVRFVACTAGEPERLVAEAVRLARPGGFVAFEESDGGGLRCFPPHPAWTALTRAWVGSIPAGGEDPIAHRMFRLLLRAGLLHVQYRPVVIGVRAGDPWVDYLPATVESLRARVLERGLIAEADFAATLAECRSHLADPETTFTGPLLVQTWGQAPPSV